MNCSRNNLFGDNCQWLLILLIVYLGCCKGGCGGIGGIGGGNNCGCGCN